jgi:hypothetical protein
VWHVNAYRRYVPIASSFGRSCVCRLVYHNEYKRVWERVFLYLVKRSDARGPASLYKYIMHAAPPSGTGTPDCSLCHCACMSDPSHLLTRKTGNHSHRIGKQHENEAVLWLVCGSNSLVCRSGLMLRFYRRRKEPTGHAKSTSYASRGLSKRSSELPSTQRCFQRCHGCECAL